MSKVIERDKLVQRVRDDIDMLGANYSPGSSVNQGWTYHPIPFAEFADVPCHRSATSVQRWAVMRNVIEWRNKTVLDMGCAAGYFSFMAMMRGAFVTGIEKDPQALKVCQGLFELYKDQYSLSGQFKQILTSNPIFDTYILLNVLNWMGHNQAETLLALIPKWSVAFIEMPTKDDGMGGADWLIDPACVPEWILHVTGRSPKELIITMGPGGKVRTLWMIQ